MSQQDSNQHDDPTSSSSEADEPKIIFAPGCFDNFEGTQEELEELIADIRRMISTGEIFENSEELSDEDYERIMAERSNTRQ